MPLPKIETPKYELIVPSTGKTVKYRPFLVREEKILLLAMESEDEKQMINAVQDIIENCVYEEVDTKTMPMFDIEYIFLQLRAKSKGEIADLTAECEKCNNPIAFQIDLSKIEVKGLKESDNKINLNDDIGIIMNYPSISLQENVHGDVTDIQNIFDTISFSIESIWDKNSLYPAKDHTKEELTEFIESLPDTSFEKIKYFFDTLPSLKHDVEIKCSHKDGKGKGKGNCGWRETKTLEGLGSFFV
jgi:hypothetical protein